MQETTRKDHFTGCLTKQLQNNLHYLIFHLVRTLLITKDIQNT